LLNALGEKNFFSRGQNGGLSRKKKKVGNKIRRAGKKSESKRKTLEEKEVNGNKGLCGLGGCGGGGGADNWGERKRYRELVQGHNWKKRGGGKKKSGGEGDNGGSEGKTHSNSLGCALKDQERKENATGKKLESGKKKGVHPGTGKKTLVQGRSEGSKKKFQAIGEANVAGKATL